jgi:thiamine-monophosphate kinase
MRERDWFTWLKAHTPRHPAVKVPIGDDAAVWGLSPGTNCVATVDMLTEGVDFILAEADPVRIGRKALAVNLSDLAAMGAWPVAALAAVVLPRSAAPDLAEKLYQGMLPLAQEFCVALAGGDTNSWDGPLAISVTAFGETHAKGPLLRSGAKPGDRILVTGEFGGSILGKHFDFIPRVAEAIKLHERFTLHAGIDVSDGLSLDLSRMTEASGCGAELLLDKIPIAQAARELADQRGDGVSPLTHALADGEDFELILAVPPSEAERILRDTSLGVKVTDIGQFVAESGLWRIAAGQSRATLSPRGYEHQWSRE